MSAAFDILVGGASAEDLVDRLGGLEVEEHADRPGAFTLTLAAATTDQEDLDVVADARFGPMANIAVVARAAEGPDHCLIDGYVLAQSLNLDRSGGAASLRVWGQDASWLMNMEEKAREWADVTDGAVADSIFGEYGFAPAAGNSSDASPTHTETGHTLMQRATDAQFLQNLARRSGKLCRVYCEDMPGVRTGWFARPKLDGEPAITLIAAGPDANLEEIDISWDIMRPAAVAAHQALFSAAETAGGDVDDSTLALLGDQALSAFAGQPVKAMLTAMVDDGGELTTRAQAVLGEAGWFVRCEGSADAQLIGGILRVGSVAMLNNAGTVHSGKYLVWSVRHTITAESHVMAFTLVRNAVGAGR